MDWFLYDDSLRHERVKVQILKFGIGARIFLKITKIEIVKSI